MFQNINNFGDDGNNTLMYFGIFLLVALLVAVVVFLLYPSLSKLFTDNFFNGSGYGMNQRFGKINTLVPVNQVSKATDFRLLSLMSQVRFSMVKPPHMHEITRTNKGIINRTPTKNSNVILFSGLSDFILRQNGREVWPRQFENMKNNEPATVFENSDGHFNAVTSLLQNLNYINGDRLNTVTYDFRRIDFEKLHRQFLTYLKPNTVIIAYDFGCVLANMCINSLLSNNMSNSKQHSYIKKFIMICPTIGGTPMTLRDYFPGNGTVPAPLLESYDSVLMSMPHQQFYDNPIAIYNSVSYKSNHIDKLMEFANKSPATIELFTQLMKKQELSFQNPGVDCVIVASDQFSTPVSYNFKNDLSQSPERYRPINNNQQPLSDIHHSGTFEGLQSKGDRIVPISSIMRLRDMWTSNASNTMPTINVELIKDKDHFTILQSYELALIIMANI